MHAVGPDDHESRCPACPLVVDLDGTLTQTDTLIESIVGAIKRRPLNLLLMPWWLAQGRSVLKSAVATQVTLATDRLPYCEPLIEYLRYEKQRGRRLVLATAAHETIAESVSAHLGLFEQVIATDVHTNQKGAVKLATIRQRIGGDFAYAGDSWSDIPIWMAANGAVLVGVSSSLKKAVSASVPVEREFPKQQANILDWLNALRVHQWLKNLLLFVPILTAFSFTDGHLLGAMAAAFLAFSLAASATYVTNDLFDLDNDRAHPRKRLRPFACARIAIRDGLLVAAAALLMAALLAWAVSPSFLMILLLYLVITCGYSLVLKRYVLIDVITLSLLYTLRILAGSVAAGILTSSWLLAFSLFTFLSLALVKRCSELVSLDRDGRQAARGRDYRVADLVVLWPLGVGAALCGVVVFGLFATASETQSRYATPDLLWLVAIGMVYWLGRLWLKTSRGEMHDDPIVYAIKDRGSRITVFAVVCAMCAARFLDLGSLS